MWGTVLKYLGVPLAQWLLSKLWVEISKWLTKLKDQKQVKKAIEKGKVIVQKLKKAKEENNEDDYNNAIDDI